MVTMDDQARRATDAARKSAVKRGYVVVGYLPGSSVVKVGDRVDEFGRTPLSGCYLEVIGIAERAEWEEQLIELFGNPGHGLNPPRSGEWFIKAKLVDEA